jgi:hypothetical protein
VSSTNAASCCWWRYISCTLTDTAAGHDTICLSRQNLPPWSIIGMLGSTLWTDGLKPFLIWDLVCASRACEL